MKDPYLAFAKAAQLFLPDSDSDAGIHPAAFIGEGVSFGEGVSAGPFAACWKQFADRRRDEDRVRGLHRQRCPDRRYVSDTPEGFHPDGCVIGNRVIIHSGAVIGADGYGYAQDEQGRHVKIPQIGIVQIDDDVEIGANATIDRATFGRTWIKRGVKIDNLVMIAHNVVVGEAIHAATRLT